MVGCKKLFVYLALFSWKNAGKMLEKNYHFCYHFFFKKMREKSDIFRYVFSKENILPKRDIFPANLPDFSRGNICPVTQWSPSVSSAPVVPALRGWSRHQSRSSKTQTPPVRHNARHPAPYPAPPAPLVPPSLTPTPSRCATVTTPPPRVSRNLA